MFVRSSKLAALERILRPKFEVTKLNGGLKVAGATTDQIGKLAFDAALPILELSEQTVTLEDAFLEVTADSQEYKGGAAA